jgi:hypothetical protein
LPTATLAVAERAVGRSAPLVLEAFGTAVARLENGRLDACPTDTIA